MTRIPHTASPVEVRQAFQRLTHRSDVLTTGTAGQLLYGQGVGVIPEWGAPPTADHGELDGLGDDDHGHYFNEARGDARYFTEAEHLNTSAGAADAGKPIKLDAAGVIDSTMLDIVATDEKVGVDSGATAGYLGAAAGDGVLRASTGISYADGGNFVTLTTNDGEIVHDSLSGYVANEHIDHTTVTLTAGSGLVGGGDISVNRTFDLDINSLTIAIITTGDFIPFWDITATATNKKITFANFEGTIDHGSIGGLMDDDHTIYLLADGSRDLTGNLAVDSGVTIDGRDISALGATVDTIQWLTVGTGLDLTGTTLSTEDSEIVHDDLSGFAANEHFLQTAITNVSTALATGLLKVTTGTGALSVVTDSSANWNTAFGWGDHGVAGYISATLTQEEVEDYAGALVANATGTHTGITITYQDATGDIDFVVDHDAATNFVANEHIDHTSVTLTAGSGITGGGDISANRSFDLDINSLAAAIIVAGDYVPFWDITATATNKKILFSGFEAALSHANLIGAHNLTTDIDHASITNTHNLNTDLDINGLSGEAAIVAADTIPFYDATAAANRKVTLTELSTALGAADVKVGVDVGATADYLGAGSGDGCLRTGAGLGYADGGDFVTLTLSHLGIEDLADAGADKILFWDDDPGKTDWLAIGDGLSISGTTLTGGFAEKAYAEATAGAKQDVVKLTWTKLTLGTEGYDPGGDFADSKYTVPTTGYYLVIAAARTDETFTLNQSIYVYVFVDGAGAGIPSYIKMTGAGTAVLGGSVTNVLYLTAGEEVELYTYHSYTENRLYSVGGYTSLTIHRLS